MFTAKEEALNELRSAHPNQEISVYLPDHCSEHLEKINQVYIYCVLLFVCYALVIKFNIFIVRRRL